MSFYFEGWILQPQPFALMWRSLSLPVDFQTASFWTLSGGQWWANNSACCNECVVFVCRGDMRGEPYRLVLLGTGPAVAAQLHLQVQSHHCRGEKKTVPTRVPQRLPTGRHPAQVSTKTRHTQVHHSFFNGAKCNYKCWNPVLNYGLWLGSLLIYSCNSTTTSPLTMYCRSFNQCMMFTDMFYHVEYICGLKEQ